MCLNSENMSFAFRSLILHAVYYNNAVSISNTLKCQNDYRSLIPPRNAISPNKHEKKKMEV